MMQEREVKKLDKARMEQNPLQPLNKVENKQQEKNEFYNEMLVYLNTFFNIKN